MKNGDQPASPVEMTVDEKGTSEQQTGISTILKMGLTKREHIATNVLCAIVANPHDYVGAQTLQERVKLAIEYTGELLNQLNTDKQ